MKKSKNKQISMDHLNEKVKWRKVSTPKPWHPTEPGEELIGLYGGRTMRHGQHGQYEVILIVVPYAGSYTVSGTRVIQQADAAQLERGYPIRLVFNGLKPITGRDVSMKDIDMFVSDERRPEALGGDAVGPGVPWEQLREYDEA